MPAMSEFAAALIRWHAVHGRHDLPWQRSADPYRVWLSEVMLQQTQVATVIPYYERFLARFPDLAALARADESDVMALWAGLGYYARGRALHAAARAVVELHGGRFPSSAEALSTLPGIGPSTAAAIAAFCFQERAAILDGNVKRVLARHAGIDGDTASAPTHRRLRACAEALLPADRRDMPAYTQAIMDLGALVCTRRAPRCEACPVRDSCHARSAARIDELPGRRAPRKTVVRRVHMLIAVHRRRVLLQQRPGAGIWGGLLAPPQFESAAALRRALRRLGEIRDVEVMPSRRVQFTHLALDCTPHVARLQAPTPGCAEPDHRWLRFDDIDEAPLPAPVHAWLREMAT